MIGEPLSTEVVEAERWLRKRFHNSGAGLGLDAQDKWGPRDEASRKALAAETHRLSAERAYVEGELKKATAQVVQTGHLHAWVGAHVKLLTAFIAAQGDDPNHTTSVHVAARERDAWQALDAQADKPPEQNCFYVTYDTALYQSLFGFAP